MAITYVGAGTAVGGGSSATTINLTAPTCLPGDLLLAAIGVRDSSSSVTAPSGWVQVNPMPGTAPRALWYSKTAASADSGASFTFSSAVRLAGVILAYRGAAGIDKTAATASPSSSSIVAPSVTTAAANEVILEAFVLGAGGGGSFSVTPPAASRANTGGGSGALQVALAVAEQTQATAGATPTQTAGVSGVSLAGVATTLSLLSNRAPNAPTITTPATGSTIDVAATNRIAAPFSDPDPGDSQSQLDLQWWDLDGTGARVGAAHTHSEVSPVQFWDSPPGTFTVGPKEMQAKSYDAQGLPSGWGASAFFTAATAPTAPTITAPANGATVTNTATLTWSTPSQDAYQVQVLDGATVVSDTGEVASTDARSLDLSFPTNNVTRTIKVRRKFGGLWSTWASITVTVSFTPPPDPTGAETSVPADAAIDLIITNPAPSGGEPTVAYNDIYYAEPGEAEERKATLVPTNSTWRHWLPASDAVYTYRIVAVASNGTTSEVIVS